MPTKAGLLLEALQEALERFGTPEIFNTDQGAQFTSEAFTGRLEAAQVAISMDGRGRALDPGAPGFSERLWRTVKYENIYLKDYATGTETYEGLDEYFSFPRRLRRAAVRRWPPRLRRAARRPRPSALFARFVCGPVFGDHLPILGWRRSRWDCVGSGTLPGRVRMRVGMAASPC